MIRWNYTASQAALAVQDRETSAEELVVSCADRIESLDRELYAWAYFDRALAVEQARAVDRKIGAGERVGALAGVPVGVKDVFNTRDMPTQMGSPIWKDFRPGNDARVVYSLRMADAVIMGKTVTAEFAVHTPGPTRNPYDPERSPGTSSSGSAAAVAASMVPVALGTQTAGSVIRPASYCGVYGFKPSFGLIPRTAMLKTTDTLDTVGLFSRSVEDLSLLFRRVRVRGRDFPVADRNLWKLGTRGDKRRSLDPRDPGIPWKVGVVRGPKWDDAEPYAQAALLHLAQRVGAEEVELPPLGLAHGIHSVIYDRTLAYYFRKEFEQHTLVSPTMYQIIRRGQETTLEHYKAALLLQRALADSMDEVFEKYDVLLDLSTGGTAPEWGGDDRPDNCLVWTLCGLPTINIPAFRHLGLPFGLQLVGRRYSDLRLLRFAEILDELLYHGDEGGAVKGLPDPGVAPGGDLVV